MHLTSHLVQKLVILITNSARGGDPLAAYGAILLYCALALLVVAVLSATATRLGRRPASTEGRAPYECGVADATRVGPRFSVRFYLIAMLFVVLDVEAVAFYPWAVRLRALGAAGLAEMAVFAVLLAIGYAHVWKKGGLDWR
jgi:NADH-quinone oxidoreductase subunit A